ncbi:MAG: phospholipase D-like domain-containing protein [Metallibacterium sp.]
MLHTKDFIVDDRIVFVGSQNRDWRALTQIHEIGAVVRNTAPGADFRGGVRLRKVRIIVANWSLREPMQVYLQSLALMPDIEVKYSALRETPQGFIPYARIEHCKPARRRRKRSPPFSSATGMGQVHRIEPGGHYAPPRVD